MNILGRFAGFYYRKNYWVFGILLTLLFVVFIFGTLNPEASWIPYTLGTIVSLSFASVYLFALLWVIESGGGILGKVVRYIAVHAFMYVFELNVMHWLRSNVMILPIEISVCFSMQFIVGNILLIFRWFSLRD